MMKPQSPVDESVEQEQLSRFTEIIEADSRVEPTDWMP